MKKRIFLFLTALILGLTLIPAYSYVYVYGSYNNCRVVGGHWYNGHYVPRHTVCSRVGYHSRHARCYYVPAHRYHGYWIAGARVCRY